MWIRNAIIAALLAASPTLALAADPIGHYTIEGKNPGGDGDYTGTAVVTKTGDSYKVVWVVAGETYVGTAIGNDEFFAVSYKSGDNTGLAMFVAKNAAWEGIWTYAGGKTIGTEVWSRE